MPRVPGYEAEVECANQDCKHRWTISDAHKPLPLKIKLKCPKCGNEWEGNLFKK